MFMDMNQVTQLSEGRSKHGDNPAVGKQSGRPQRGFYTIKEAAHYLAVSDKSVRRAIKRGLLKPSKAFRKLLIPAMQLETDFYNSTC